MGSCDGNDHLQLMDHFLSPSFQSFLQEHTLLIDQSLTSIMDDNSDLSEALALKPFTSLPSTSSGVSTDDAKRADGTGRSILCCCDNNNQNNTRAAVPGIVFRAVADNNGVAVEAVQFVSPSGLTSEEDAENKYNIEGGEMNIIGSFSLSDADENSASSGIKNGNFG